MQERAVAVITDAVQRAGGDTVVSTTVVHGGDTSVAYRVETNAVRRFFAKTCPSPPAGFFTTEAASLVWLTESSAVHIPAVVAVSDGVDRRSGHLVLHWIQEGSVPPDEVAFGRSLAGLHGSEAPSFGRADGRTTGSLGHPNDPTDTWAEFVAARRFTPLARIARDRGSLPDDVVDDLDRLASTLDRFDDGAPPARLHGDLWAGNRLVGVDGESWLIDPAAHGGHREFDLAMMRLFRGFGSEVIDGHQTVSPLTDDWQDRIELHQIAPLVVHAIKFGGGYVGSATRAVVRYR